MEDFVLKQLELIELEREAEIEKTRALHEDVPSKELEKQGLCLRKLRVARMKSGLYGRVLVKFEPEWAGKMLPSHVISPGDIVGIGATGDYGHKEIILTGVVWSAKVNTLTVAFESSIDNMAIKDHAIYNLVKIANDVTYRRLKSALLDLKNYKGGRASCLIDIIFGISSPSKPLVSISKSASEVKFVNESLDESQRKAVLFSLHQKEIAIVHGPPGTGKTTTVVEVICQSVAQGLKVLACGPSNVAVDNMVEKLAKTGVKLVRLGHPARTLQTNQNFSLDAMISLSDNYILMKDIQKDMDNLLASKNPDKGNKRRMQSEAKILTKELRTREIAAITDVLKAASVILATLSSSHPHGPLKHLPVDYFDLIVIDECSQALEAACWIPLLCAKKCVLAGDHLQLPPTIISEKAAKQGLEVTLMERILKLPIGGSLVQMLVTQYRMHAAIMQWPSDKLYAGKLMADSSVKEHLLCDLPNVENNEDTSIPLLLIDTAGCNLFELALEDDISKGNEGEANLVAIHVDKLISSGLRPNEIAVIAPYNLQVEIMRALMLTKYPNLEIKSVDGFQGREKEAVILTLTRSNEKGEVGFLAENRRINVAITRARRHLVVICDSETISHHTFLKEFVEYMSNNGEVRSAHQYDNVLTASSKNQIFTPKHKPPSGKLMRPSSCKPRVSANKDIKVSSKPNLNLLKSGVPQEQGGSKRSASIALKYQRILEDFMSNKAAWNYTFPSSLSSFERMLVHEMAENLDLVHTSQGEGEDRCIVVCKKSVTNTKKHQNAISVAMSTLAVTEKSTKIEVVSSDKDSKLSDSEKKCAPILSEQRTKKKKKKTEKLIPASSTPVADENLDMFLADLAKKDNTCSYNNCKTGISILRQVCSLCDKAFCMQHFLPEVHGCGDLIRAHARQKIKKEGVITPGSGSKTSQKTDPSRRAHLEKKLEKKLNEFGNQRIKKPKPNK